MHKQREGIMEYITEASDCFSLTLLVIMFTVETTKLGQCVTAVFPRLDCFHLNNEEPTSSRCPAGTRLPMITDQEAKP